MTTAFYNVLTPRTLVAPAEDGEDCDSDESNDQQSESFMKRLHNTWGSRVVYASFIGMAVLGLATTGWLFLPLNSGADTQPGAQAAQPTDTDASPQAASRFLSSEDMMSVVAEQSVKYNPHCQVPESAAWEVCKVSALVPHLQEHMSKHLQKWPKELRDHLDSVSLNGKHQEAMKAAMRNLADSDFHAVAQDAVSAMVEVNGMKSEDAMNHIKKKLANRQADMDAAREKLFPASPPPADAHGTRRLLATVLAGAGIHMKDQQDGGESDFDIEFRPEDLKKAAQSLPKGDQLGQALFAPGMASQSPEARKLGGGIFESGPAHLFAQGIHTLGVLHAPAVVGGPPPPQSVAGNIVGAIGVPFAHLAMCILHHLGMVTLPFWTKVLFTVEDVISGGGLSGLPLIGLIIDLYFMWKPRGYTYLGCSKEYPQWFLSPEQEAKMGC